MKKVFLVLILSLLLLAGCINPNPIPEPDEFYPVEFSVIDEGSHSAVTESTHKVINSQKELGDLYKEMFPDAVNTFPSIDFDKYTVVAVFAGEKPNPLYKLEVKKVLASKKLIKVYVNEIKEKLPEDTVITPVTVQPFEIIKFKKTNLPVKVFRNQIIEEQETLVQIDFSVVESDLMSVIETKKEIVIDNMSDWEDVYAEIHSRELLPEQASLEIPAVDFDEYILIGVFAGEKPNPNYGIKINKIIKSEKAITVQVQNIYAEPPEGTGTIQVIVQPYEIIKIKKTSLPIEFECKDVIVKPV